MKKSRGLSFLVLVGVYALAFAAASFVYGLVGGTVLLRSLLADVAATVLVWAFSIIFDNASVYDPYWSVAPLALLPCWVTIRGGNAFAAGLALYAGRMRMGSTPHAELGGELPGA